MNILQLLNIGWTIINVGKGTRGCSKNIWIHIVQRLFEGLLLKIKLRGFYLYVGMYSCVGLMTHYADFWKLLSPFVLEVESGKLCSRGTNIEEQRYKLELILSIISCVAFEFKNWNVFLWCYANFFFYVKVFNF